MNKKVELVDLVDSLGVVKMIGIPRTQVDLYPDLHLQIAIGVIFDSSGLILVHKRARTKKVNPGDIDHICGGIMSGESPQEALIREGKEETGIEPKNIRIVLQGINKYNRYRYLLIGESDEIPGKSDRSEVEWVRFTHPDELKEKQKNGEFTFVDEFFEDTDIALNARK